MTDDRGHLDPEVWTVLSVSREEAFKLLEDPDSFRRLVPGARRIRRFDPRWPELGTRMEHTVGFPPLVLRDHTEVLEYEPPANLRLAARIRPLGELVVQFRLEPHPAGSKLTVGEEPARGPVKWPVVQTATRAALRMRNRNICRRFRSITDHRRECGGCPTR